MQYIDLKTELKDFIVFSTNDIEKIDPSFHNQRLSEWQKKGYIKKIRQGYYVFSDLEINEKTLFLIANKIYAPSYISLEMALSWYNLIPEAVYGITCVTSRKTADFQTPAGNFIYKHIKPELMFGYDLGDCHGRSYAVARMEKAVLDYLYLNPSVKDAADFDGMRFNALEFKEKTDTQNLEKFLAVFKNKSLNKRVGNLMKYANA